MKDHSSPGFFVFRTPILSWRTIETWATGLRANEVLAGGGGALEDALTIDALALRERLRDLVRDPAVREALFVASPSLDARLAKWLDGDKSESAQSVDPVVVRYLMRMAGRATPFGLFAAAGVGAVGGATSLAVPARENCTRHTRLDMDYVFRLTEALSADGDVRPHLRFVSNESGYDVNGRLRYIEARAGKKLRTYHLVDVDRTPYLDVALAAARSRQGATIEEVAQAVTRSFPAIGVAAATAYVNELVSSQLLWSPLSPAVTGREPVIALIEALEGAPSAAATAETLRSVLKDLDAIDASGLGNHPSRYASVADKIRTLPVEPDVARLFQVDLHRPCPDVTLSQSLVDEVGRGVELLQAICPVGETTLDQFARAFHARYQEREVPLLEALDEESGVGFEAAHAGADTSPLFEGVPLYDRARPSVTWHKRERLLLQKLQTAALTGAMETSISDADLQILSMGESLPLPPGFSALVAVAAASSTAADRGEYRMHLQTVWGSTSSVFFGRFCHGDPELASKTRQAVEAEDASDPDAIHAELAHLPQGRVGNVICRPIFREYEIPVVGGSGTSPDHQIQLSDLLLSVRDGRFRLRSRRLGKRVVVHLSSAHAFQVGGLSVYRFLAQLQGQGFACNLRWAWGPLEGAPFLPRVVRGRFVLSLAQWTIDGEQLKALSTLEGAARWRAVQDLRATLRLPRFVRLADADNTLPVDLDNVLSVESLFSVLSKRPKITLTETFPAADRLVATGSEGAFHHELIVPFVRKPTVAKTVHPVRSPEPIGPQQDRSRRPGDDWLYVKVYGGVAALDRILVECVLPLVRELRADKAIGPWFFVRYADPDWHLRLRFQAPPDALWREVAPRVFAALSRVRGISHKVVVDTYDPEVERYGGDLAMPIANQLFEADSDAAIEILSGCRADRDARWRLCLLGMNALLSDLDLPTEARRDVMAGARNGQMTRYLENTATTKAMGDKFRALRVEVAEILERTPGRYSKGAAILARRSAATAAPLARLRQLEDGGLLTAPRAVIAASYLHMWANRMFRGSANPQELILYDFLARFYEGKIARAHRGAR
jgi:thiopeptide-type bacteriocin biosynthesis protein